MIYVSPVTAAQGLRFSKGFQLDGAGDETYVLQGRVAGLAGNC
jgi:hypothetical protein